MSQKTKPELEHLILKLFEGKREISVHGVALAAGLSIENPTHRRAIQRALRGLIDTKIVEPHGKARARTYCLVKSTQTPSIAPTQEVVSAAFKDIHLSDESKALLQYVSQSQQARAPVGYNQNFLRSYVPNQTRYLTEAQRADLLAAGRVENTVQPAGTYARNIQNRLLIDLSWNSSRLEGNTYSLLETKRLIELGEHVAGKDASETQMILNHKSAIEYIFESSAEEKITSHEVFSIHALLSENLLGDPSASGRLRQIAVGVGGTNYLPLENPHVLNECFHLFIEKLNRIENPFEQSFFALAHLSYMQAFDDVNKRTARVVANIPLIKGSYRPLSFMDVDKEAYVKALIGVYEKADVSLIRDLYIWAYKRSSQRYSAVQQAMGAPNLLRLKYRAEMQTIIRAVVLEKITGPQVVNRIQNLLEEQGIPKPDATELFHLIETEILSLHAGNIARFKIRPSEFQEWKSRQ